MRKAKQVASQDLCERLFRLTGWDGTDKIWYFYNTARWGVTPNTEYANRQGEKWPAYTIGDLLRKLPGTTTFTPVDDETWKATCNDWYAFADTPENALCLLLINLTRHGAPPA